MADGRELAGNDHTVDILVSGMDDIDDVGEVEAEVLGAFDRAEVNGRWTVAITRCSDAGGWDVCVVSRCADRYVTVATRVDPVRSARGRVAAAVPIDSADPRLRRRIGGYPRSVVVPGVRLPDVGAFACTPPDADRRARRRAAVTETVARDMAL